MLDLIIKSDSPIAFLRLKDIDVSEHDIKKIAGELMANIENDNVIALTLSSEEAGLNEFVPGLGLKYKEAKASRRKSETPTIMDQVAILEEDEGYLMIVPYEIWSANMLFSEKTGVVYVSKDFDIDGYVKNHKDLEDFSFRLKLIQDTTKTLIDYLKDDTE